MVEVGQIRHWVNQSYGRPFLIIEVPALDPDEALFLSGWVRYIEDGKDCYDKIDWIEENSEVICEAG